MSILTTITKRRGADAAEQIPFSFTYGGRPSGKLLATWKSTSHSSSSSPRTLTVVTYTDPDSGLEVIVETTRFDHHEAIESVLRFRNAGQADTALIEAVLPLDASFAITGDATLHHSHGSTCQETDFLPLDEPLAPNQTIAIAPRGGRSSDGALPFFNVATASGGIVCAIGWSGQWRLTASRDADGTAHVQAGQETTRFKLHPGEEIRTPRILLVAWTGADRMDGHNALRKLLVDHYVPRIHGAIAETPIAANTWFTFNQGNEVTEANQKEQIEVLAKAGVEYYWLDAGWFEGGWPNGAGSWEPKPAAFPRGLRPVSDEAHHHGMKFVLWFEPERVSPTSLIGREHPEWVMKPASGEIGEYGGLFNLGNPTAREWLTHYLAEKLIDWKVDVFRNDFNIEPLPFWQAADEPDRQGIAENRYVEGLYRLWDDLRKRKPGLTIDNCASGGRRIDLETISRSYPLWQSDTQCCGHDVPIQNQVQNMGLSLWIPQHTAGAWRMDKYGIRSVATSGFSVSCNLAGSAELIAQAHAAAAEVKALRPYLAGEFYPLLPISLEPSSWCAWQYHRSDLCGGFVTVLRRAESPYDHATLMMQAVLPEATYYLCDIDANRSWRARGQSLLDGLEVPLPEPESSMLIRYQCVE